MPTVPLPSLPIRTLCQHKSSQTIYFSKNLKMIGRKLKTVSLKSLTFGPFAAPGRPRSRGLPAPGGAAAVDGWNGSTILKNYSTEGPQGGAASCANSEYVCTYMYIRTYNMYTYMLVYIYIYIYH